MTQQSRQQQILIRSATELARTIRSREVSSVEIVEASLRRIDEINPRFNAFTAVYREEAIDLARAADAMAREADVLALPCEHYDTVPGDTAPSAPSHTALLPSLLAASLVGTSSTSRGSAPTSPCSTRRRTSGQEDPAHDHDPHNADNRGDEP
jgi:hypothetical protein